jgi:tight adherence protein B
MLAVLAILMTGGAVFFFVLIVSGIFAKAMEKYQERYVTTSANELSDMFLFIDGRQLMVLSICLLFLMGILGYFLMNPIIGGMFAIVGFFMPMFAVRLFKKRRIKKFNVQLVDALQAMANAFKAGLTFPQAVDHIARDSMPPLSQEFGLFVKESKLGVPLDEALINMGKRVGSEDLDLVVVATNISRQLGGNMAEMFETIGSTIRERFRLEGKIDAITSQGKMQGMVVACMPLVLGLVLNYMRPDLMEPMMDHMFGYILVGIVFIMEVMGMYIINKIVSIDV